MAFLSIIRRWHKRDHVPIREISRRTGVSRNTIRKYLRSDVIEPKFRVPDRPSKLDPYAEKLSAWLRREAGRPRKQRRTAKQLYGDLVSLGYDGSYNRVAAFARDWKEECKRLQQTAGRGSFVPLSFAPGEAFQFDWSEDWAVIGGERVKLQVAHVKLCYSRAFILRAYLLQTHEMLFDAHNHAFRVLGGRAAARHLRQHAHRRGQGRPRQGAQRQRSLFGHGQPLPVRSRVLQSGCQAGRRGRSRRTSRMLATASGKPCLRFESLNALNDWLEQRCRELWGQTPHGSEPGMIADAWAQEVEQPDAGRPAIRRVRRVHQARLADLPDPSWSATATACRPPLPTDRSACASIPTSLWSRPKARSSASIPASSTGPIPARDGRCMTGATIWRSSSESLAPCAMAHRSWNCPRLSSDCSTTCSRHTGGDREMVEILALVLHHDEQAVLAAVELALEDGVAVQDPHPQPAPPADRRQAGRCLGGNRPTGLGAGQRAQGRR